MDLGSPSESAKLEWPPRQVPRKGNVSCNDSSHEVCFPYSVSPLGAAASLVGIASPDRLRLQVFSTSWRLDPPRACWPYLMPDPLMGFRPPEPYSSRAAVRRLRRLYPLVVAAPTVRRPTNPQPTAETIDHGPVYGNGALCAPRLQGLAPHESPPLVAGGLDRRERVALLGFLPPGFSPPLERHGFHRTSPHELGSIERERSREPALQGLDSSGIGSSLARPPTLLGFHAS